MARRIKDLSGVELLKRFETLCFLITNYPNNKIYANDFSLSAVKMIALTGGTATKVSTFPKIIRKNSFLNIHRSASKTLKARKTDVLE